MNTNWKKLVEKKNAETYVLPDGWDSRAAVAEQLDCSEDKVDQNLRPALKSGEVEKKQFVVWDKALGRKISMIAYRSIEKPCSEPSKEEVLSAKEGGLSWTQCGLKFGITGDRCRRIAGVK